MIITIALHTHTHTHTHTKMTMNYDIIIIALAAGQQDIYKWEILVYYPMVRVKLISL